ncbi:MAG: TraR/DksA family transcriptional regulator [Treponema sp.]|nr:TraR/DksA family transcriptional regulator [Candidatus Treponema caballi]
MDKEFDQKMKEALLELKSGIIDQLMANNADFRQIVEGMEAKDEVDVASDAIDRKMLEAVGSKDMNRLKLIDSALARIEQGRYGLCMKCGKRIPQERLEAIPYALLCIECKSSDERKNR